MGCERTFVFSRTPRFYVLCDSALAGVQLLIDHLCEHAVHCRTHHFQRWGQALVFLRELGIQHYELTYGFGAGNGRVRLVDVLLDFVVNGGRISLSVGLISCLISVAIGILAGCLACFGGRLADSLIMRTVDVVICFPVMFLIITISCFITPTIYTIMLIIGLVSWTGTARLVRGEILKIRELEYVQSSIVLGAGNVRIVFTHVLPNIIAPVVVQATLSIASAILTEASLSFLGVGVAPPTPSWGNMINAATNLTTLLNRPWIWLPPGLCILVTVLCINLIGDGLRDAFDAKTR